MESFFIDAKMPTITVYLDAELYDYVKQSPSAIIQKALKRLKESEDASPEN